MFRHKSHWFPTWRSKKSFWNSTGIKRQLIVCTPRFAISRHNDALIDVYTAYIYNDDSKDIRGNWRRFRHSGGSYSIMSGLARAEVNETNGGKSFFRPNVYINLFALLSWERERLSSTHSIIFPVPARAAKPSWLQTSIEFSDSCSLHNRSPISLLTFFLRVASSILTVLLNKSSHREFFLNISPEVSLMRESYGSC